MDIFRHIIVKSIEYLGWVARKARPHWGGIALLTVLRSLSGLALVAVALVSREMVDRGIAGDFQSAFRYGVYFALLVGLHLALDLVSEIMTGKISEKFSHQLRENLFNRLAVSDWLSASATHSGDWMTRLTGSVSAVSGSVVMVMPEIFSLVVQFVAAFVALLVLEPRLAVFAFLVGPVALLLSNWWSRKLGDIQEKAQECDSAWRAYLQDAIRNLMVLKAFSGTRHAGERLASLHRHRYAWAMKETRSTAWMSAAIGSGYWLGYLLAFGWGVVRVSTKAATFGTLTAFLQLVEQVQGPFVALSGMIPQLIFLGTSVKRLRAIERLPLETAGAEQGRDGADGAKGTDGADGGDDAGRDTVTGATVYTANQPVLRLDGIRFGYDPEKPVLQDTALTIQPGEIVGLVGPSGEGKTTLVRLILHLVRPQEGTIHLLDPEKGMVPAAPETRRLIAYVPQGHSLFQGSIAENLRLGNPDADDAALEAALRASDAWAFVSELENGMDTMIGEDALGLSEGQAQRVAIARALVRKAPLLILDEATSSLDQATEERMLKAIAALPERPACIVVTHRPAALSICSRVVALRDGQLHNM